jgi:alpha-N-arabinofuranosidase
MQGGWREAPPLLEEQYNLEDALVAAQYLAAFVRRADVVKVACIAQVVNVIAPILTRPNGLLVQSIYYPLLAFSQRGRGVSLTPAIASPTYAAGDRGVIPALDAAASYDASTGDVELFLVNRDLHNELRVDVRISDRTVTAAYDVQQLTGADVKAANTWEHPLRVTPTKGTATVADGVASVVVPAPGFVVARLASVAR